jgi:hypothetical protein
VATSRREPHDGGAGAAAPLRVPGAPTRDARPSALSLTQAHAHRHIHTHTQTYAPTFIRGPIHTPCTVRAPRTTYATDGLGPWAHAPAPPLGFPAQPRLLRHLDAARRYDAPLRSLEALSSARAYASALQALGRTLSRMRRPTAVLALESDEARIMGTQLPTTHAHVHIRTHAHVRGRRSRAGLLSCAYEHLYV